MEEKKLKREILKEYLKSLKIETDIENTILILPEELLKELNKSEFLKRRKEEK